MAVLNYTTKIATAKTVGEVQAMLAGYGANRIAVDYTDRIPTGLTFAYPTPHGVRVFSLPVDVAAMHRLLVAEDDAGRLRAGGMSVAVRRSREHAERVAWRVMKDWIAAQLTLVGTQMAQLDEVMLPYLVVDGGQTLYAAYRDRGDSLMLEGGRQP